MSSPQILVRDRALGVVVAFLLGLVLLEQVLDLAVVGHQQLDVADGRRFGPGGPIALWFAISASEQLSLVIAAAMGFASHAEAAGVATSGTRAASVAQAALGCNDSESVTAFTTDCSRRGGHAAGVRAPTPGLASGAGAAERRAAAEAPAAEPPAPVAEAPASAPSAERSPTRSSRPGEGGPRHRSGSRAPTLGQHRSRRGEPRGPGSLVRAARDRLGPCAARGRRDARREPPRGRSDSSVTRLPQFLHAVGLGRQRSAGRSSRWKKLRLRGAIYSCRMC